MLRVAETEAARGAHALLVSHLAVHMRRALDLDLVARWITGVLAAEGVWTTDFGGEQFSLGRAFYTHLETDRADLYFADARASDARVERHAPGLQATMRELFAQAVSGRATPRPDWCSAGVHVFPLDGPVASRGGVVHFDTEGLAEPHITRRAKALSLVAMLQAPATGGGLRFWPLLFEENHAVDDRIMTMDGDAIVTLAAGDVVLFDSYRLHQILPFGGPLARISATLHGAEILPGVWETWF
jgi:hypothetical protein